MKKLLLFFIAVISVTILFGTSSIGIEPTLNANKILLPVGGLEKKISLMELSKISTSDFQKLTGRKMIFFDRIKFRIAQKKLRNSLNDDGSFSKRKVEEYFKKVTDRDGFNAGGFFLGLSLLWFGVLFAYLFDDDKKRNRVKWAWIGMGVSITVLIIIMLSFANASF